MLESRGELTNYRDLLELSDRIKKVEVKKVYKDSGSMEVSKKPGKAFTPTKPYGTTKTLDLKDVECFKCHKKGHYANKCPEIKAKDTKGVFKVRRVDAEEDPKKEDPVIRQVRIRYSDLHNEQDDHFIRHWIMVFGLHTPVRTMENEGKEVRIFVDTGANVNTISRQFMNILKNDGLEMAFIPGSTDGMTIQLAGSRTLSVSGDRVQMVAEVATNLGPVQGVQEFLVMEDDTEDMVMGVQWHSSLVGGHLAELVRIVDVDTMGMVSPNPLDSAHDQAPEDSIIDNEPVEVFPMEVQEVLHQCHFNPNFPMLDELKKIVSNHGNILFQAFDYEGLRVPALKLKVNPLAKFRMQPCRFVRASVLTPLKALIDQFVMEGV
jgi:hypothetical protein